MGLLSRLSGMASTKKATDDVLLAHAMLLMAGADGDIDDSEIAVVRGFATTLPEFKERDFGQVVAEAQKMVRRYPNLKESVNALTELSTPALKAKAYVLAADIALASGDVDEAEDELLTTMQRLLGIDDQTAQTIIWVLQRKYEK
ncbi:MAG: tellurite resistance TerB family protein [Deltaproteobacteria bacterium]|nr:tellurite resistance TerB family protein [Deltaproteobacteria bacterium]MBK8238849.1 tellurite resistance TerB family protein [Deltaproteobacteria bacterium]MBK8715731.1 tellurite resistance TerB family protein [Deltaproteobacteria bacterium]MBP7288190.1 tellurite resistance TerB family protein [Nannocystaceae bacterium]